MNMEKYYVYMLQCADGSFYTGYTNDLAKRIQTHNAGRGAKYTRVRRPVQLVYSESYADKHEAMSREALIKKRLTHQEKVFLIAHGYSPKLSPS
jgi:putative endonuclease